MSAINLPAARDLLTGNLPADKILQRVTIESRWLPPIVIDQPLASTPGAAPNPLLAFLAPRITIETPLRDPMTSAPWGEPQANYWPQVKIALIVLGIAGVAILAKRVLA